MNHPSRPVDSALPDHTGARMRLNIFQQLMRSWTAMGPYNAGQAMRLSGQYDLQRWQKAIYDVVQAIGLGTPQIHGDSAIFIGHQSIAPHVCQETLESAAIREINTPFSPHDVPLRFLIIPENEHYWMLAIYDHWIADSWSIRELMRLILTAYCGNSIDSAELLHIHDQSFEALFSRRHAALAAPLRIWHAGCRYFTHRRSWRFDLANPMDFSAGCAMHALPDGLLAALARCAKAHQCSLNDIFLAAVSMVIGQMTADSRYKLRRRWWAGVRDSVSIGSIVDIRALNLESLDHTFGLFLSSCITTFKMPERHTPSELIRRAARQTGKFKRKRGAVTAFGELAVVKYVSELYQQPRHKALFFQKNCPLLAGISNVNLTGAWMDQVSGIGATVQDYIRISPVGPLLPVVFALTTFRSQLRLCLTWRKSALTDSQAAVLAAAFIKFLEDLKA
jgi:hypothetical protein